MAKRELIGTGTYQRSVRRDERGRFVRSDDVGRSLSSHLRTTAANAPRNGRGDRRNATRATARTSWLGIRPIEPSVAVIAGLIAITAGAVLTSATLRRGTTR